MKKISQFKILFLFFLFQVSFSSFASIKRDTVYVVEVDGKVLIPENDGLNSYKIKLICNNIIIDSAVIIDNESFLLKIKKNSKYSILFIKEGYCTVSIQINTQLPVNNNRSYTVHFDVELMTDFKITCKNERETLGTTISFDRSTDAFTLNESRWHFK